MEFQAMCLKIVHHEYHLKKHLFEITEEIEEAWYVGDGILKSTHSYRAGNTHFTNPSWKNHKTLI